MSRAPSFTVQVPATSANLGPGFDCMGVALNLFNEMTVEAERPFEVDIEGESASLLPTNRDNAVVQTMQVLFDRVGAAAIPDFKLRLVNRIPVASGLGSSATAIVGGLLLANALVEWYEPKRALSRTELQDLATELEGHPDNVTPALRGGACLICNDDKGGSQTFAIPVPDNLFFVVAVPYFMLPTKESRNVVPMTVPREDAVYNISQAARLALALGTGQLDILRGGFGDKLHEPYRRSLVPGWKDVHQKAIRAGAIATTLSGAGPSMLAWCDDESTAWQVADQMTLTWREHNIPARTEVYQASAKETTVVRE